MSPVLNELNLKVFLTCIAGIAAVVMALFFQKSDSRENIVYVQSGKESKSDVVKKNIGLEAEEKEQIDLAPFEQIIHSEMSEAERLNKLLSRICMEISASQGAFYQAVEQKDERKIELAASFAFSVPDSETISFEYGEGLAGQVAKEGKKVILDDVPDGYIRILSGLGEATPQHLFLLPVKGTDEQLYGVAEISSFSKIKNIQQEMIESVFERLVRSMNPEKEKTKPGKKSGQKKEEKAK
jgi:hypothetical protein